MDIKNAEDVQLLVEDMGWKYLPKHEIVSNLEDMNHEEITKARHLVNQRVWDETLDDEMAATARWHYTRRFSVFAEAIQLWAESQSK
jgi:hypothetical protein